MQSMVMASRAGRAEHTPEAEPVLVERVGDEYVLTLDDGETLGLDRRELRATLDDLDRKATLRAAA
jgi:hypothetical protein